MLKQSPNFNENWGFRISRVDEIHPIPDAHSIVKAVLGTDTVVVGADTKVGDIVAFFPVGSCISPTYLGANNLFEAAYYDHNSNRDDYATLKASIESLMGRADKTEEDLSQLQVMQGRLKHMVGFFNVQGRVRALKLRGQVSMGYVAPVSTLEKAWPELRTTIWSQHLGKSYDMVGSDLVCWKWVPAVKSTSEPNDPAGYKMPWYKRGMRNLKKFDRLIPGFFKQHYDTAILERNAHLINPTDDITLTVKVHGTSVILANLPVRKQLNWWYKLLKKLGCSVDETEFGEIYSTRRVIQNKYINPRATRANNEPGNEYQAVNEDFIGFLTPGMTVYGEIAGYKPNGKPIQAPKGITHDYGCLPGQYVFMPYRITETGMNGEVTEWSVKQVNEWTAMVKEMLPENEKHKIMPMTVVYEGKAGDMYNDLYNQVCLGYTEQLVDDARQAYIHSPEYNGFIPKYLESLTEYCRQKWRVAWIEAMKNDRDMLGMELPEPMCRQKNAPREGVVLRITGDPQARAWKLKSQAHHLLSQKAADAGEADPEDLA